MSRSVDLDSTSVNHFFWIHSIGSLGAHKLYYVTLRSSPTKICDKAVMPLRGTTSHVNGEIYKAAIPSRPP